MGSRPTTSSSSSPRAPASASWHLVDGDTDKAYDELTGSYHVAVVAKIKSDGSGKVTGFQQIRDLVASICD